MRRFFIPLLVVALIAFIGVGVNQVKQTGDKLQLREVQLKDNSAELKELKLKYDNLNVQLDTTSKANTEQIKKLEEEKNKLEQERIRLEGELQAKLQRQKEEKDRQNQLAQAAVNKVTATATVRAYAAPSGTCAEWISAAGITEVASANELIRRESGCNPNAVNRSSGACGVAQELPCGKSGCEMGNGRCQVAWMNQYVKSRYGSWGNAVAFHDRNNWY